jgi:hypothetical protein
VDEVVADLTSQYATSGKVKVVGCSVDVTSGM